MHTIFLLHWGEKEINFQPPIAIRGLSIKRIFNQAQYFRIVNYDQVSTWKFEYPKKKGQTPILGECPLLALNYTLYLTNLREATIFPSFKIVATYTPVGIPDSGIDDSSSTNTSFTA